MQRFLYTSLYYLLTPVLFLRLIIKHQKSTAYKELRQSLRLSERLGFFTLPDFKQPKQPIWIHTVSVGEFIATLPLIRQLLNNYSDSPLVITCTTTTGSAQIVKTFATEIQQGRLFHCYLPYDLPGSVRRFLNRLKPSLGLIMETEIWPNLLSQAARQNIPLWLLNARMSARSAKGYARFQALTQYSLQKFTGIAAQDRLDAERLIELGADKHTLHITGSIKFDLKVAQQDLEQGKLLRGLLGWQNKTVLMAASTHKGEEEILLDVFKKLRVKHPELVLLIVPRHPERFEQVYQLLTADNNSSLQVLKRSDLNAGAAPQKKHTADILLGDSMGEMMCYFACSDRVFMGGTLVPVGGHNILEPAALKLPIVYGPHIFNFYAINELFLQYRAARQVAGVDELEQTLDELLSDPVQAEAMAHRAGQLIAQNTGALDKILNLLKSCLQ